jgi:hypothetical protein
MLPLGLALLVLWVGHLPRSRELPVRRPLAVRGILRNTSHMELERSRRDDGAISGWILAIPVGVSALLLLFG